MLGENFGLIGIEYMVDSTIEFGFRSVLLYINKEDPFSSCLILFSFGELESLPSIVDG